MAFKKKFPYRAAVVACQGTCHDGQEQKCTYGCIGCVICQKTCTAEAIHVVENCAVIDDSVCLSCGMCAVKCPRHAITDTRGILV